MDYFMMSGLFITFEGIDGSGKSVQASALKEHLEGQGRTVTLLREPGGTVISEKIRRILLDNRHHRMNAVTEFFLYEAARSQLMSEKVLPLLEKGTVVICDRFTDSTMAYQGYGRSLPVDFVHSANSYACSGRYPDRTYFLDISWDESLRRRRTGNISADRMEKEHKSFFRRVREGYLAIAEQEPERVAVIKGTGTIEEVSSTIAEDIHLFINTKRGV